ncbi:hypothetical protein [Fructobacillus cardui]|uniref:hypothetical protein n=1 Tax=Fructobacillus cardui TaxID=2893170 RepID=UPI00200AABDE|nr:hypothetical protein [Fructobacillus cardui]MCK8628138.1 hypothetical protein [Fructobacillus cardui]
MQYTHLAGMKFNNRLLEGAYMGALLFIQIIEQHHFKKAFSEGLFNFEPDFSTPLKNNKIGDISKKTKNIQSIDV